jgi:uncharacterized protein YbjT (DUF2867 family)
MSNDRLVLVSGATGSQGGAVARQLLQKGFRVRAMTRKPDSDKAKELAALGAEIVCADLDDEASLPGALKGAWAVWAVQNTWEAGVEKEEEQGKRFARLAKQAGVQKYIYTSVGSAHRNTGIPHFDNKWRVEETVRSLGFPYHSVLRPVYFMENLIGGWALQGDKLMAGIQPTTKLQMVAVEDIGKYGAMLFEREDLNGVAIDIAGDAVTMPEAAEILSGPMGKKLSYVQIPIEAVRQQSEDVALMYEWFDRVGYDADIEGNKKKYGIRTLTLPEWIRTKC